jgi:hypothetical protein
LFTYSGGDEPASVAPPATPPAAVFPLHVEAGKRYLVDASGSPFLLHADTAWSLIADLSIADAELYLEDRRRKGFNTVIVNLLERKFATKAPNNLSGDPPFTKPDNYDTPNPAYFAHADRVIKLAASKDLLVLLVPSYLGFRGGSEGWYSVMSKHSRAQMRDYGRFLGQRYAGYKNILWVHGGDFNPPIDDKPLVNEIALGIREFDTRSLHSVHGAPETSALGYWAGETWLQINNIYTYTDVSSKARAEYGNPLPFFLIESRYENDNVPEGNEQRIRVQAYQALLSGAMGHAFGNNPVWHFTHAGIFPVSPQDWKQWLDSAGARSMVHLRALFSAREWWRLEPDFSDALVTKGKAGSGVPFDRAVAAKASDGSFALVYMPTARALTVHFGQMAGPNVSARWYDPANGQFSAVVGSPFAKSAGARVLRVPGVNRSTTGWFTDWVLVLESG